ncbi:hypothetical protein B0H12DRAFT_851985 [Mycena haematopus]|nr:hypothetical protein B0H12DRAFT_851985 [Mycena haematopus]
MRSPVQRGPIVPSRERAFLRAFFHIDYQRLRVEVACRTIAFMHQNPGKPFWVGFMYDKPHQLKCDVCSKETLDDAPVTKLPVDWVMRWQRLAQSSGRIEIDLLTFGFSGMLMCPMTASTSKFQDGLTRIAREILPGVDATQSEQVLWHIRDLIAVVEGDPDSVEIH